MYFSKEVELSVILDAIKSGVDADSAFTELCIRYEPMMRGRVASMFRNSDDELEAMQEAHIALHRAALTYDQDKCCEVTFGLYAGICVCNRLRSMLRAKSRASKRLDELASSEEGAVDPESFIVDRDQCQRVMMLAKEILSEFEYSVFRLEFEGYTTRDIAKKLSRTPKSVDNAKFRIAKRLRSSDEICDILS